MYDVAPYYSYEQTQEQKPSILEHTRKQSLLLQPNEAIQANGALSDALPVAIEGRKKKLNGPPKATVSRRAQSYSDFHYAVKTTLRPEAPNSKKSYDEAGENIKDDLQFTDWYHSLEEGLEEASSEAYANYKDELRFFESYLDSLSSETSSSLEILASLSGSFKAVKAQTTTFQRQCENLLSEQKRLTEIAGNMSENLKYYSYLEPINRRLNAPGAGSFIKSKDFSAMLARLDECLNYMAIHPSQKEASVYQSRYRLLMTRGLTLVRVHFVGALREISQDVTRRIADRQLNDTTMSALLYAKFRVGASELKEVAQEIKKRATLQHGSEPGIEAEYQGLMDELYTSYAAARGRLVIPLIRKKIQDISLTPSSSKDLVSFARTSIGYIKGMCADEYELWREWFEGEEGVYDFLESVCEPLYDHLRPRIIHENQLLKLCELCTYIQTRYTRDQDEDAEPIDINIFDFSSLIHPALEDAQTRLVFRTQAILRDDIENYKPKPEDLDYPTRTRKGSVSEMKTTGPVTSGTKAPVTGPTVPVVQDPINVAESDSLVGRWGFETSPNLQGWYPTLRKAIWLLSRIYRLVNSTVFDDLAHRIVHQTTLSLHRAADQISKHAKITDGQLFLLKHLLLLKQQIVAFDIEYVTPDISFDFSGMTNTFYELRDRGGLFDLRNLWRFVGMGGSLLPRVVENMLDAKVELDGRLRTVINDFTRHHAEMITHSIKQTSISAPGFDPPSVVRRIQETAGIQVPLLRQKLDEYLDDARTKETLVAAVQDQVLRNYESFYDIVVEGPAGERRNNVNGKGLSKTAALGASKKGKGREDGLWDPDSFAEWTNGVFRVRRAGLGLGSMDGGSRSRSRSAFSRGGTV